MKLNKLVQQAGSSIHLSITTGAYNAICMKPDGKLFISKNGYSPNTILMSSDNGVTWATRYNSGWFSDICCLPNGRLLVRGIGQQQGLHYSDNDGTSWTQSIDGYWVKLFVTPSGRALAIDENNGNIWYSDDGEHWTNTNATAFGASFCVTSTGRIYTGGKYSDDNGETWNAMPAFSVSHDDTNFTTYSFISVTPTGKLIVSIYIGDGYWYSDDGGETWQRASVHHTIDKIYRAGNRLFACGRQNANTTSTPTGIWYSDDDGETWTPIDLGEQYRIAEIFDLIILPDKRLIVVGSCWTLTDASGNSYSYGIFYSDPEMNVEYASRPITRKEVDVLVEECKAYIQSKKQS